MDYTKKYSSRVYLRETIVKKVLDFNALYPWCRFNTKTYGKTCAICNSDILFTLKLYVYHEFLWQNILRVHIPNTGYFIKPLTWSCFTETLLLHSGYFHFNSYLIHPILILTFLLWELEPITADVETAPVD